MVALTALFVGQLFLNRWLVRRQLERVMREKSTETSGPSEKAQSWRPLPGAPPRSDLGVNLLSRQSLPEGAAALSEALVRRSRNVLRWGTLLDLVAAAAYMILLAWHSVTVAPSEAQGAVGTLAPLVLLLTVSRYLFYREQHTLLGAESPDGLTFYTKLARFLASPRWQLPLRWVPLVAAVLAVFSPEVGALTVAWFMLAMAVLHGLAEAVLMLHVQRLPSLDMLISRVFGNGDRGGRRRCCSSSSSRPGPTSAAASPSWTATC